MSNKAEPPYFVIYEITNRENGKRYIGKHKCDEIDDGYMGSGKHLKRAIKKHGIESFDKKILFVCSSEEEMNKKEAEIVTEDFCRRNDTYNICPGGQGGWGYVNDNGLRNGFETRKYTEPTSGGQKVKEKHEKDKEWSRKVKDKISQANKGNKNWLGKKHSESSKEKIGKTNSLLQTGKKNSQYGTMWITNGKENKKIKKDEDLPNGWQRGRVIL